VRLAGFPRQGELLRDARVRPLGWAALAFGIAAFVPFADFFAVLGTSSGSP
jgi:hypothetical protein